MYRAKTDIAIESQRENGELSPYPPKHELDWNSAQSTFEKWSIFRAFPVVDQLRYLTIIFLIKDTT